MQKSTKLERQTVSGYPKLTFKCHVCGFECKTSGMPFSCPSCGFNPIALENKNREEYEELVEGNNRA